ncbi:SlyX family protein [Uliginosibacterium sp. H1]|uniref:SlyX family protein n=1 Tax=Uliginosibacterium sp. H1 TaxID=3114757 RepID=UPI002E18B091|nr:SlyX family protein [Uliginosibacterium sp. H1]
MEDRIAHLEAQLTHAEDLLDELNRTVFRQQQQIDQLQQQLLSVARQMSAAQPGTAEPRDLRDEIPPHY